ncbi:MAG: hypothetical protein Kow0059_00060 [Candidatus Sumerlaeia bacterium]
MITILKSSRVRWLIGLLLAAGAAGVLLGLSTTFFSTMTIVDLIRENKKLQSALSNLTAEHQIGYAKVLSQDYRDGRLFTRLLFVQTDRTDPSRRILEREYEIEGDVVYFDALIVKFQNQAVADGKERALYLWRRVYGETQSPSSGFPIETPGDAPRRYADISARLSLKESRLFWQEIWELSNDPTRLEKIGVSAIFGNVVYKKLRPGLIYVFKISPTGALYPETIPDL